MFLGTCLQFHCGAGATQKNMLSGPPPRSDNGSFADTAEAFTSLGCSQMVNLTVKYGGRVDELPIGTCFTWSYAQWSGVAPALPLAIIYPTDCTDPISISCIMQPGRVTLWGLVAVKQFIFFFLRLLACFVSCTSSSPCSASYRLIGGYCITEVCGKATAKNKRFKRSRLSCGVYQKTPHSCTKKNSIYANSYKKKPRLPTKTFFVPPPQKKTHPIVF